MIKRSTWIVLGVFLLLLAGAYLWQRNQPEGETGGEATPTPPASVYNNLDATKIKSFQVDDSQGGSMVVERDLTGMWSLVKPQAEATDAGRVEAAISQLTAMMVLSQLDPQPAQDVVGLNAPAYVITLKMSDGTTPVLKVGKVTPTSSGYYVQLDKGPILVVSKIGVDDVVGLVANPPVQLTPTAGTPAP